MLSVRGIEEDMATQPIQFDLLSVGSNSQVKLQSHAAGSNVKGFDVSFVLSTSARLFRCLHIVGVIPLWLGSI